MHQKLLLIVMAVILVAALCPRAYSAEETEVLSLINSQGCKACHSLNGKGGIIAGSFEAMRENLTRAQIRSQLVNPKHRHGDDKIPDFSHLSKEEIDILVHFIQPKP